jgi:hypothetical protein
MIFNVIGMHYALLERDAGRISPSLRAQSVNSAKPKHFLVTKGTHQDKIKT